MPNHVENIISVDGDIRQIRDMLEKLRVDDGELGTIDFNKIIPMPKELNIEAGSRTDKGLKAYKDFISVFTLMATQNMDKLDAIPIESENAFRSKYAKDVKDDEWELGRQAWNNIRLHGYASWYEWCIANWGTKWNAYHCGEYSEFNKGDTVSFQTAWGAPHPVLQQIAKMYPEITFTHRWADEDLGSNCGERIYENGELVQNYYPEGVYATDFALEVWDYDAAELEICKNATGTKYISLENESYEFIEILNKPALFTSERLTNSDIPQGLYCYHLRSSDDGEISFATVEPSVKVNHSGSIVMKEPLNFGDDGLITLDNDSSPNFTGEEYTFGQFMNGDFDLNEGQQMV